MIDDLKTCAHKQPFPLMASLRPELQLRTPTDSPPQRRPLKQRRTHCDLEQAFRTSGRTDLVYHIEHLFNLDFPGDKNLVMFRNKWYDLLLKMRSEDRPSKLALRDILYRKIKGSKKMEFGLNAYHRLPDKHPQKTYEFLLALIDYQIKADREDLCSTEVGQVDDEIRREGCGSSNWQTGEPGWQGQKGETRRT